MLGGEGNDVINGNGGDDIILGEAGSDTLSGGTGRDLFSFGYLDDSTPASRDWIVDFNHAEGDRIELSSIDAIAGGPDDAFTFTTAFTGVAGQLIATGSAGNWLVEGDIDGDSVADFAILVGSADPLVASDFIP